MLVTAGFIVSILILVAAAARYLGHRKKAIATICIAAIGVGWLGTTLLAGNQMLRSVCGDTYPCVVRIVDASSSDDVDPEIRSLAEVQRFNHQYGWAIWAIAVFATFLLARRSNSRTDTSL